MVNSLPGTGSKPLRLSPGRSTSRLRTKVTAAPSPSAMMDAGDTIYISSTPLSAALRNSSSQAGISSRERR